MMIETLGMKRLATWMRRRGHSQEKMGRLAGVSQETISRYLSGTTRPKPDIAVKIEVLTSGRVKLSHWFSDLLAAQKAARVTTEDAE